jgi:hypothetical protein
MTEEDECSSHEDYEMSNRDSGNESFEKEANLNASRKIEEKMDF